LKPSTAPRPITGGGGNTATNASWMEANLALSAPAMAGPYSSLDSRSSKGARAKKMMPALEAFTNPLMDSPGNCTAPVTPGCCRPMSAIFFITSVVRSSVAASGSWAKATR
jgi:hypothetical protein